MKCEFLYVSPATRFNLFIVHHVICSLLNAEHTPPSASTVSHHGPHSAPCFVDDIFAALREGVGSHGELTNRSLAQFGICTESDSSSVLLQLAKETNKNQGNGLEVLHPGGGIRGVKDETGTLVLTFELSLSPLLKVNPVLLLAFESPLTGRNLDITFTSQSLHPSTQVRKVLKTCPELPYSGVYDFVCICWSLLVCVHLRRNAVHSADRKSNTRQRSADLDDFC